MAQIAEAQKLHGEAKSLNPYELYYEHYDPFIFSTSSCFL